MPGTDGPRYAVLYSLVLCAAAHAGQTSPGAQPSAVFPAGPIELDAGRGESQYLKVDCAANAGLGQAPLRLDAGQQWRGKADLFVEQDHRLVARDAIDLKAGAVHPVWIKFSTRGVPPGCYPFRLTLAAPNREPLGLDIRLTVWPLDLPRLDNVHTSAFWSSFCSIFGKGKLYSGVRDRGRMLEIWKACNEDLQELGQDMLEIRFDPEVIRPFIRVARFEGRLPVLELGGWDPILSIARRHDMRHAVFRYNYSIRDWCPPGYDGLSPEQQAEVQYGILEQLTARLKRHGFERVFWYLIDEIDPYASAIDPVCAKMARHRQRFPQLEFAGSGFAHVPLRQSHGGQWRGMEQMAPYLTWIAPYWGAHSIFRWIRSGALKVLPQTIVATQISASHDRPYAECRRFLWALWREGGNGYQIYGYHTHYPEHKYSPVFPGPTRPIHSPAYAALVDGHNDFQYLHACRRTLAVLKAAGRTADAERFQEDLDGILGRADSLLKLELPPPARYDPGRTPAPRLSADACQLRQARRLVLRLLASVNPSGASSPHRDR